MANKRNRLVVPESARALDRMKNEIAAELGFPDYDNMDKGELPARLHGSIGGSITKKLVALGQESFMQQ